MSFITESSAMYAFLDFDMNNHRAKLATAAAFVDATDSRYGFSGKDLRALGGSELSRIQDLIVSDHEWSSRAASMGGVQVRPPTAASRIVVRLYWDVAPLACENFATLCSNGSLLPGSNEKKAKPAPLGESGKPLTYRNSIVHRVIPGFIVQGGDFVFGNGSGGESIFNGKKFKDERAGLNLKHDRRGLLSMGNGGKNSNSSQWFLTFKAAPQCDGKHVIFGEMVSGWEVLDAIEKVGTSEGNPSSSITITDCGIWAPFLVPACGYWFDQPDAEAFSGVSPTFMVRPRVAIVGPNAQVLDKFSKVLMTNCSVMLVNVEEMEDSANVVVASKLSTWLESFQIDCIVAAPACKDAISSVEVPISWIINNERIPRQEVVLEAKPVQALTVVWNESWLSKRTQWKLDGQSK